MDFIIAEHKKNETTFLDLKYNFFYFKIILTYKNDDRKNVK